jgi:hypothetical protein
MGRLGNQIFQFASTLGIAHRKGLDAKFPMENCYNSAPTGPIDFSTGENTATKCDLLDCFNISTSYFAPRNEIKILKIYHESEFCYNYSTESIEDFTDLYGYFQTEKYFSHCRDYILSQLVFRSEYSGIANSFIKNIRDQTNAGKLCSIHVRRGDYVMYPNHHPCCSLDYYKLAIHRMKTEFNVSKFVVFSDDTDWCKTEFTGDEFIISDLKNPYSELCSMSLCDNQIIANSSFSWWGAWLNQNKEKIVISPSRWFGSSIEKDTSDIYCDKWKII